MNIPDFNAELSIGKSSRQYRSPLLAQSIGSGSMVAPAYSGEDFGSDELDSSESTDGNFDHGTSDQSEFGDSDGGADGMEGSDQGDLDE